MSIITEVLKKAVSLNASDVHFKLDQQPFFRVHSELAESGFAPTGANELKAITAEIVPEHLQSQRETAAELDFAYYEKGIGRFRVNVFLARHIPTIAMRHVKTEIPSFESLNLPESFSKLPEINTGIIMLSGATGSGKSTTLAAVIRSINSNKRYRIITIEDPVEYVFDDDRSIITQREVGLDTPSFHSALKYVLRQDPDVIMIGEMRDDISMRVSLRAAETGHIVLTTIHANTAALAVPRILDFFPPEEREQVRMSLAANLRAILCQRLLPRIGGGVAPAVEILFNTPTVRKLLQKNELEVLPAAIETGNDDGMQTFNQAIYKMIKTGIITETTGLEYSDHPESLKMNLKGIFLDESRRILST